MSETSGVPSAIGIEAVECLSHGPAGTTILVTGRWRDDRPEWRGPAMLVIEDLGTREQVPAMPEPPSLGGLEPGMWRMCFSVPPALVSRLNGRTWLQLGAVTAPLTLPRGGARAAPAQHDLPAARDLRRYEIAAHNARRQAEEADGRAGTLEAEVARLRAALAELREAPDELKMQIEVRERELCETRQQLHAEVAQRAELEERLGARNRMLGDMRARVHRLAEHERELESELRRMYRAVDEAHHEAATARVAAERAEAEVRDAAAIPPAAIDASTILATPVVGLAPAEAAVVERPVPVRPVPGRAARARLDSRPAVPARSGGPLDHDVVAGEQEILRATANRTARASRPAGALEPIVPTAALGLEQALVERAGAHWPVRHGPEPGQASQPEPTGPEDTDEFPDPWSDAQRRLASLEEGLSRGQTVAKRAALNLGDAPAPAGGPENAAAPSEDAAAPAQATAAPSEDPVAPTLAAVSAALAPEVSAAVVTDADPDSAAASSVEADRLRAALERLRERHPPADSETDTPADGETDPPEPSARPDPLSWQPTVRAALPRLFRSLVRDDPEAAGRLALQLLPAQRLVHQRPIAYDLVIQPTVCVQLTMGGEAPEVSVAPEARPDNQTQFRITGEPPRLAKLLAAGPVRRRLRVGLARVHGDRSEVQALRSLVRSAIGPAHLEASGVRLDPKTALQLISLAIDPGASAGERFTIAHRRDESAPQTATLHVDDGRPMTVGELPLAVPATTTVICPAEHFLAALLGYEDARASVSGDGRPLNLVRAWLEHA